MNIYTKTTEKILKISGCIVAIIFCTNLFSSYLQNSKQNMPLSQIPYCVISPDIPTEITFADERIDLTIQDRRERLDREIMAFTYSHINTLLQIKRANRLFPIIEPILKECGIPDDFKYLMIIESNGDTHARSIVGAAGLWQFMEKTGKEYGLEINSYVDERYDIEKATRAACRYLKKSYEQFGDWITVAASYNAGAANIAKRIESQKESKAINLALLPETSRYIFRILTAKHIFTDPVRYGFLLKSSDLYPPTPIKTTITINGSVENWAEVAKEHGLNFMQLRESNMWIRNSKMPNATKKEYKVIIPDGERLHYNPQQTTPHNRRWVIR